MSNVKITQDNIIDILSDSDIQVFKMHDKCTVVVCKLPNGFILTESSACVDPENFDEIIGYEICMQRIENKLWELEGYALQKKVYENDKSKKI